MALRFLSRGGAGENTATHQELQLRGFSPGPRGEATRVDRRVREQGPEVSEMDRSAEGCSRCRSGHPIRQGEDSAGLIPTIHEAVALLRSPPESAAVSATPLFSDSRIGGGE